MQNEFFRKLKWDDDSKCKGVALLLYDVGFEHKVKLLERSIESLMYKTKVMQTTNAERIMKTLSKSFVIFLVIICNSCQMLCLCRR